MINKYLDLSDQQIDNLLFFLDKSDNRRHNVLKEAFGTKKCSSLKENRDNVTTDVMAENINFKYFLRWLSHIHLEGNNSLYVFEPRDKKFFNEILKDEHIQVLEEKVTPIYNLNVDTLKENKLIDVYESNKNLLLTVASPSIIIKQDPGALSPELVKDIYLSYFYIKKDTKQIVLIMHPTAHLFSISNVERGRDFDKLAKSLMVYFKNDLIHIEFDLIKPSWIENALYAIIEEYYDHNNEIIYKKLDDFNQNKLEDIQLLFSKDEPKFCNDLFKHRIKKSIEEIYEFYLIKAYGTIKKETPFGIFLNESGKGVNIFQAKSSGNRSLGLDLADSYEIVKKMLKNTDISSIGISYNNKNKNYPYKVTIESNFFSLKRVTNAVTEKEIIDNVLYELKKYNSREKVAYRRSDVR